jgi:hypothetical protein
VDLSEMIDRGFTALNITFNTTLHGTVICDRMARQAVAYIANFRGSS